MKKLLICWLWALGAAGCINFGNAEQVFCTQRSDVCGDGGAIAEDGGQDDGGPVNDAGGDDAGDGGDGGQQRDGGVDSGAPLQVDWLRAIGSSLVTQHGTSAAVPSFGDTLVGGSFTGTNEDFGGGQTRTSATEALFVAAYAEDGAPRWVQVARGDSVNTWPSAATGAPDGSVIIGAQFYNRAGSTGGTVTLPNGTVYTVPGSGPGAFLMRLANDGGVEQSRYDTPGGFGSSFILGLGTHAARGELAYTGNFYGNVALPGFTDNAAGNDWYIARLGLDFSGGAHFTIRCSQPAEGRGTDLAFAPNGDLYALGYIQNSCQVPMRVGNPTVFVGQNFTNTVVKVRAGENAAEWVTVLSGWNNGGALSAPRAAIVTVGSRVFVVGGFSGTALDGGLMTAVRSDGGIDVLLVELDPATGVVVNQNSWGTPGDELIVDATVLADGGILAVGEQVRIPGGILADAGSVPLLLRIDGALNVVAAQRFETSERGNLRAVGVGEDGRLRIAGHFANEVRVQPDSSIDAGATLRKRTASAVPTDPFFGRLAP